MVMVGMFVWILSITFSVKTSVTQHSYSRMKIIREICPGSSHYDQQRLNVTLNNYLIVMYVSVFSDILPSDIGNHYSSQVALYISCDRF